MKKLSKTVLLGLMSLVAFTACDDIDEADRITLGPEQKHTMEAQDITVETEGQSFTYRDEHRILIEDFTGWRCVNCPNMAAFLANNIEKLYPSVVVSLHPAANTLSNTDKAPFSLSCTLADEIANNLAGSNIASSLSLPAVSLDQKEYEGHVIHSGDTTTVFNTLRSLAKEQYTDYNIYQGIYINLAINVEKKSDNNFQISTLIVPKDFSNMEIRLQLWLLESGIVAYQSTQTGTVKDYVNNHVLRMAINGNEGEIISLTEDNIVKKHNLSFDNLSYVPENCSVVAIISNPNTKEVINCIEVSL